MDIANAQSAIEGVVKCGHDYDINTACKLEDLFGVFNSFSAVIISVFFPVLFFFGLFMIALPLINQYTKGGESSTAIATAKSRAIKLMWGTIFVVGSYFILKAVLVSIGYTNIDVLKDNTNKSSYNYIQDVTRADGEFFSELYPIRAHADSKDESQVVIENPLNNSSVEKILMGVANMFVFIIIVGAVLGIIRGVMLLLTTQEKPENLIKGKQWIFRSLGAAAIVLGAQMFYNLITDAVTSVFK